MILRKIAFHTHTFFSLNEKSTVYIFLFTRKLYLKIIDVK